MPFLAAKPPNRGCIRGVAEKHSLAAKPCLLVILSIVRLLSAPARKMRIKKPYYDAIMSGRKTLEVRVGYGSIKRLRTGELLQLETSHESGAVKIKSIRTYDNFAKMLTTEDWQQIVPQAKDRAEALQLLQKIYPPRKEKLGVYTIEVAKSESSAVQCMS